MKPTSPEEKELEQLQSEAARRYRTLPDEEPPASLDQEILAAARRAVEPPRARRSWQVPASVAAVLVVGVTLAILVRDVEPPLPTGQAPSESKVDLAKAAPNGIALKTAPQTTSSSNLERERGGRPSRERTARPGTETHAEEAANASLSSPQSAPAAAPAPAATAPIATESAVREMAIGDRAGPAQGAESRSASPAAVGSGAEAKKAEEPLRRKDAAVQAQSPEQVRDQALEKIRQLLDEDRRDEARERLVEFRRRYPEYSLPASLRELLPPEDR